MSASQPFFSRRVTFFGNVAVLILCVLFFLVPFGFRGARIALSEMKNEVADWLPADFPETRELENFRDHFVGAQFVVLSWDGCVAGDPRFEMMVSKLKGDAQGIELPPLEEATKTLGDELGLHVTDLHEGWSSNGEKWLLGDNDQWYFLTSDGGLYRWTGGSNLVGAVSRSIERFRTGTIVAQGELVHQFAGEAAETIYANPRRLNSRLFKQVLTGPDVLEQLAGPNGTLIRGDYDPRDPQVLQAKIEAHQRLTGVFFGPTPARDFNWTRESFLAALPQKTIEQLPDAWPEYFDSYVERIVNDRYAGDRSQLLQAPDSERLEHWLRLFFELQVEAPPRPTCIVAALSNVATRDLSRVVGRPDFFKAVGRVYLAAEASGLEPSDLHLGGPPVDNVAIDEEGTITLFKLVSLSTLIGLTLAYISFRSIGVTMMIFFVGGVAAVTSLGFVWFGGSKLDAVLLSMPSLVYVLGLSGAVHIVNYYREECHLKGEVGACERGLSHGWFACTLAAFTTALGLISLYTSNLIPIQKFGLFSAVGTLATLILLFAFLPSALTIWPPHYTKKKESELSKPSRGLVYRFWDSFGSLIVRYNPVVIVVCLMVMIGLGLGLSRIRTNVQLLKLFDDSAKVIADYQWLENHLGRLVPMELVVEVEPSMFAEEAADEGENAQTGDPATVSEQDQLAALQRQLMSERRLTFLERMEMSSRVRRVVEAEFGESGRDIIGPGMSSDVMLLPGSVPLFDLGRNRTRGVTNQVLLENRQRLNDELDFFRIDKATKSELWRVSLRLGAFNNVDYGRFVADLQQAVEPVLVAYRIRDRVLRAIYSPTADGTLPSDDQLASANVLILGWKQEQDVVSEADAAAAESTPGNLDFRQPIDQTSIFCESLGELLENRGFSFGGGRGRRAYALDLDNADHQALLAADGAVAKQLDRFSCIVLVQEPTAELRSRLQASGIPLVIATDHELKVDPSSKQALSPTGAVLRREFMAGELPASYTSAAESWNNVDDHELYAAAVYTGIVPIVYKAQRTLLASLADSIVMSFWMIAIVMMILLRDWRRRISPMNFINVTGGLVSMIPNLFPVIVIFGTMGLMGTEVDIGSMMTASVALGVAVDDTIHFLSWFRTGMRQGLDRISAIRAAYAKVATAMTQTTLIAGLGLSAFAFSTFTPTQRFGILMLALLFTALIGDLILLPAILASRIGKLLEVAALPPELRDAEAARRLEVTSSPAWDAVTPTDATSGATSESGSETNGSSADESPPGSGNSRAMLDGPHGRLREQHESKDR